MPGGCLPYQAGYIDEELSLYIKSFDIRIGTLEAAIGTGYEFDPVKMAGRQNIIYARDEDFKRIKELGFNVISLANNHIMDLGESGLINTINHLKESGILFCGAGINEDEASAPAVIEKAGVRIAIFAYCVSGSPWLGYVKAAGRSEPGVNILVLDKVLNDIRRARSLYDRVIVMPHWGKEYTFSPLKESVIMAKQMIDAGADAVIGSHTHQIQPQLRYKGKPVFFSLGNFLFPDFYMYPPRPIWYPDDASTLSEIEDVVGYPFPIDKPLRQVWNQVSRYGLVVEFEFGAQERVTKRYVHLSNNNQLSFSRIPLGIRISLLESWLDLGKPIHKFYARAIRKIRRMLKL